MFYLYFLYVVIVASECLKNISGVAHGMRVKNGWRRRSAAEELVCKPDELGCSSLTEQVPSDVKAVPAKPNERAGEATQLVSLYADRTKVLPEPGDGVGAWEGR
jgi:hypothetical protein